ncbi:predicted protein [Uncinocarpus reesii 1704]|uniref:Uncharacterized protein n=1 Tax=Uncinocarpus reesii (strain UAMH 1704) TaxID=336963 RepID=C4JXH0_UNCRE|nr:uncharacterized protein UREG_06343 [Uncinocarpus reesii 1704]EEP81478.1 predicted protein [Uncinocarpus reesii 1704]
MNEKHFPGLTSFVDAKARLKKMRTALMDGTCCVLAIQDRAAQADAEIAPDAHHSRKVEGPLTRNQRILVQRDQYVDDGKRPFSLMAPVYSHALRHMQVILPPRPTKGPPGGVRVVNSVFGVKPFSVIFAATFLIFVVAVSCWKFGAFFRSFSRHKVIGGGEKAGVRYAKTWYGWVPLERYTKQQRWRRELLKRFRRLIAWRTCHADYSWVWWDPEGTKVKKRVEDWRPLRWIPPSLADYAFSPLHSLRDKRTDNQQVRIIENDRATNSALTPAPSSNGGKAVPDEMPDLPVIKKRVKRQRTPKAPQANAPSINVNRVRASVQTAEIGHKSVSPVAKQATDFSKSHPLFYDANKRCISLPPIGVDRTLKSDSPNSLARRCASDEKPQRKSNSNHRSRSKKSAISHRFVQSNSRSGARRLVIKPEQPSSWRYKAWGARMQRTTFPNTPIDLRGLAGRPGTPLPETLKSLASTRTDSDYRKSAAEQLGKRAASDSSFGSIYRRPDYAILPISHDSTLHPRGRGPRYLRSDYFRSSLQYSHGTQRTNSDQTLREPGPALGDATNLPKPRSSRPFPQRRISNPEVRLIDDLERKLEWLSSEMDPGRKSGHFSLVYNHWLNRATWVVYDPVSRVPCAERRLYGDPRHNYPYPSGKNISRKEKYPSLRRGKARAPRLDSWRLAVNAARKSSGVREFLKAVELFEGSADEPPDGAIDTATWILRKPPQGFEMSSKQREAYFEGCGGWFEKLEYWRDVPRGYRARKVVCEGRANRRRIAEIGRQVAGNCKRTASKIGSRLPQARTANRDIRISGRVTKLTWHPSSNYQSGKKTVQNVHRSGLIGRGQPTLPYGIGNSTSITVADSVNLFLRNRAVHFLEGRRVLQPRD